MKNQSTHRVILKAACGRTAPLRVMVNPRAKRILLRIDAKKREAVAVAPSKRHLGRAQSFAEERVDWIVARLEDLPQSSGLEIGGDVLLRGVLHRIEKASSGRSVHLGEDDGVRIIHVPGRPDQAPSRVVGFMRASARTDLSACVAAHAQTLGVKPSGIAIKDTKSRWGSCSSAGNLNFSWRLICAPPEVLDYVAAHEVSHLLEMNHSSRFWAHVETCCPDFKPARKWLNEHGRMLHAIGG